MPVAFANPAGFWALLAIPVIVLIHFLQREMRRETCTTLFLLEPLTRESAAGNRFEWLRQSPPLWLQLLCMLLLTWVLVEPRWRRPEAVQPIAFVLDSSASMQPFAGEAQRQVAAKARLLGRAAARTEFFVIDSALPGRSLYRGPDVAGLVSSLTGWAPSWGLHDFTPALRVARNTVGRQGLVVLVSDHASGPLPFDALLLAVGSPLPNAGFAGLQVESTDRGPTWKAVVRNYSPAPVQRQFVSLAGGRSSPPQALALAPREIRTISGPFPPGATEFVLQLTPDEFPLDDVLPVLAPRRRTLRLTQAVSSRARPLADSLLPVFAPAEPWAAGTPGPDLSIRGYDPLAPGFPAGPAVVFVDRPPLQSAPQAGGILPADHPLMEDLRWEALIVRPDVGIPFRAADIALLWLEGKPLVWLRNDPSRPGAPQLVFNFDPVSANAAKLPAFVLLLHRYAELVREGRTGLEHRVAETHQSVDLPAANGAEAYSGRFITWDGRERPLALTSPRRLELPPEPGFAAVEFRGEPYLRLATHFGDTREADLSQAASVDGLAGVASAQVMRYSEAGMFEPLWIALLTAALLASWAWQGRQR